MIELQAHAKINLSLEVTGQLKDGYHSLVSLMQLVSLHDTLLFAPAGSISMDTSDPLMTAEGDNNLVMRAAHLLRRTAGVHAGAYITLHKRIPTAAGLGGGSSDAAATLLGLSRLWGLDLPPDELSKLGGMLGSDVPFFFRGPTALVEGRGEQVTPLVLREPFLAVLVCRPYSIPGKTKRLYAGLRPQDMLDGAFTYALAEKLVRGEDIATLPLRNSFERTAFELFPGLGDVRRCMLEAGAGNVHLSGSGPTLYTLFPATAVDRAYSLHEKLQAGGLRSYCVTSVA